jgi:VIT1/CCC1 family predicted Fe2+/Mn2+ transporter
MAHDALAAHARDELGLTDTHSARPIQAAIASASTFTVGAALPLLITVVSPTAVIVPTVTTGSLLCLAGLGAVAAQAGGANALKGAVRVTLWGAVAMAATAAIGAFFGTSL